MSWGSDLGAERDYPKFVNLWRQFRIYFTHCFSSLTVPPSPTPPAPPIWRDSTMAGAAGGLHSGISTMGESQLPAFGWGPWGRQMPGQEATFIKHLFECGGLSRHCS